MYDFARIINITDFTLVRLVDSWNMKTAEKQIFRINHLKTARFKSQI